MLMPVRKRTISTGVAVSLVIGVAAVVAVAVGGCGGGSSRATVSHSAPIAKATTATTAAVQPPHVRILSPRTGAHTGTTLTVNVRVTGTLPRGARFLRYTLDSSLTRKGAAHLTFHGLAPGRHRLEVTLTDDARAHAVSVFTVRAPTPAPATPIPSAPAPAQTTTTMQTTQAVAPPPKPETSPSPTTTPKPPASSPGIPQGNGGDGDSDNNGGPSDGDGNV
jgi:hypothetical protein